MCDLVSDAILDACVQNDENSRVACTCCTKAGMIMILGEITTSATINYEVIVRETLRQVGYDDVKRGLDYRSVNVIVAIEEQSTEVIPGTYVTRVQDICSEEQCVVFGYASDETEGVLLPLTHLLASSLALRLTDVRKTGKLPWLRPDGKVLVTCEYSIHRGKILLERVHTIVICARHDDHGGGEMPEDLMKHVVRVAVPSHFIDDDTVYHLNSFGQCSSGHPHWDSGLSGRTTSCETCGGWVSHCGRGLSGRDARKMDRAGTYAARWIAKSLVKSRLCHRVLIQVSYAVGVSYPISLHVDTFGSGSCLSGKNDSDLVEIVKSNFDLRPGCIIRDLELMRPIMFQATKLGHFTPPLQQCAWEIPKKVTH